MAYIDDVIDACVTAQLTNPKAVPDTLAADMIRAGWSLEQVKAHLFERMCPRAMGPRETERDAERLWLLAEACSEADASDRVLEFVERDVSVAQAKAELSGQLPSLAPFPDLIADPNAWGWPE